MINKNTACSLINSQNICRTDNLSFVNIMFLKEVSLLIKMHSFDFFFKQL